MNLLVLLVSAMHWFNPLVYIMAKAVRTDCEAACDEAVVAGNDAQQRRHYGETIIGFVGSNNARTPVLSTYFFGGSSSMKKRLFSIMDTSQKRKRLAALCAVVVLVVTLLSGTLITASSAPGAAGEPIGVDNAKAMLSRLSTPA